MEYREMVEKIANGHKTTVERGEMIIKESSRLITDIVNYRYMLEHYNGGGTTVEDTRNLLKKSLAQVKTDLDIYIEQLGATEEVERKANKRLEKIMRKL